MGGDYEQEQDSPYARSLLGSNLSQSLSVPATLPVNGSESVRPSGDRLHLITQVKSA